MALHGHDLEAVALDFDDRSLVIGLVVAHVEPVRSQNSTVTVLRTSREAPGVSNVAPQLEQKRAPNGLSKSQLAHVSTRRG
jgi:hypothetical protein